MKATFVSIAVLAASVSADSTACAAETILDACLDTTEGYLSLCGSQDYSCLCDKYTAIMTCFANCPNDDRQYALDSQRQLYCANASAFSTKTTSSRSLARSTTKATATDSASAETTDGATSTFGNADATSSPTPTSSGAADIVAAGQHGTGMLAAFAGVVAAALL
ncbi:hypothetical protein ANO14919_092420 [Xylariales sp. No.14919]|nr:hypothetical protein F5X98DRAFT_329330 [Xylaria grammica]GAW19753.1 hypothetical protein ANO14919_092420 [Xylariales sp. No.14919]